MKDDKEITTTDFKNLMTEHTKGKGVSIDVKTAGFTISADEETTKHEMLKVIMSYLVKNNIPTTMLENSPVYMPKQAM